MAKNTADFDITHTGNAEHIQRARQSFVNWNKWRKDQRERGYSANPNLRGGNFKSTDFSDMDLRGVDFGGANLTSAQLDNADIDEETSFSHANFTGTTLPSSSLLPDQTVGVRYDDPNDERNPFNEKKSSKSGFESKVFKSERGAVKIQADQIEKLEQLVIQGKEAIATLEGAFANADLRARDAEENKTELDKTISSAQQIQKDLKNTQNQITSILETEKEKASESFLAAMHPELEAAKAEVKVDGIIGTAYTAWKTKQRNHWIAFGIGAFVFIASILVLLIAGIRFENAIAEFIRAMSAVEVPSDGTQSTSTTSIFGRLAAITIPVAAIAWMLRLISRFTLQNLTLANDAGQRKVCIDTYAKLVGTEGALDEKDRAIMLNSIFRPLPGSQQEDISPPNLLDLVSRKID